MGFQERKVHQRLGRPKSVHTLRPYQGLDGDVPQDELPRQEKGRKELAQEARTNEGSEIQVAMRKGTHGRYHSDTYGSKVDARKSDPLANPGR